jgi:hypothetical protein
MALQKETALQRIQVGVVGLVAVLLFVSLANMVLDRAIDADANPGLSASVQNGGINDKTAEEPLAEIGVAPNLESDNNAKKIEAPKTMQNVQNSNVQSPPLMQNTKPLAQ